MILSYLNLKVINFLVLLQPFNYDPNEKNKHKFMVQYLYLNDEEMALQVNDILNMVINNF